VGLWEQWDVLREKRIPGAAKTEVGEELGGGGRDRRAAEALPAERIADQLRGYT